MKKSKSKTYIIGAGPAGLTAAYHLVKNKQKAVVLEADNQLGGISKTINYKGYRFDIGGHRFLTKMNKIFDLWIELIGKKEFLTVKRLSRIYYKNKFYSYPLKPLEALKKLGIIDSVKIGISYIWIKLFPKPLENNFENWIINRFGKSLYQIFFKTYTEKILGVDLRKLSADWASQRIKGLSLFRVIISSMSSRKVNRKIKTLTKTFHYPLLGPGQMWETAGKKIIKKGGKIITKERVVKIKWAQKKIRSLNSYAVNAEVLSSMPIIDLIKALEPSPPKKIIQAAKDLQYRDFITVGLIVKKKNIFPDNWIYIHDPQLKAGRIQNYKNWSKKMVKNSKTTSSLGIEYFCNEHDMLWKMKDKKLVSLATQEIVKMGFIKQDDVIDATVIRMKKAYPIYSLDYKSKVRIIRDWLEKNIKNLMLIGRNGMHRYNNQDHSMLTGLLAAKNIVHNEKNNIWQIDPDASDT